MSALRRPPAAFATAYLQRLLLTNGFNHIGEPHPPHLAHFPRDLKGCERSDGLRPPSLSAISKSCCPLTCLVAWVKLAKPPRPPSWWPKGRWGLRRPSAAFATGFCFLSECYNSIGQFSRYHVARTILLQIPGTCDSLLMSAQTAYGRLRYQVVRFSRCCNPIGQFHKLPVASVGFVFFPNRVDVDLPLDVKTLPGKCRCIRSNGVGMHSEQTNKQTDRQTFFLTYIED